MNLLIQSKPMEKWDLRFCELAKFISEWSKDPDAKVGAVVVSKRGGAISTGYNGFPIGVEDSGERLEHKDTKLELVVHAELNALLVAGARAEGATLYVWGKPVCSRCTGSIIQAGIRRVVSLSPYSIPKVSKWRQSALYAHEMFTESGVTVDFVITEG